MSIYIDAQTGTWGEASDLILVDGAPDGLDEVLDGGSDSTRGEFAAAHGSPLPLPGSVAFDEAVERAARALCGLEPMVFGRSDLFGYDQLSDEGKHKYRERARAALTAVFA